MLRPALSLEGLDRAALAEEEAVGWVGVPEVVVEQDEGPDQDERRDDDDRSDADENAEHGQRRAQLVPQDRGEREANRTEDQRLFPGHRFLESRSFLLSHGREFDKWKWS